MQVSVEESLSDLQNVCFQAALLYTSSKGMKLLYLYVSTVNRFLRNLQLYVFPHSSCHM
jgi:hypothetical protein